MKTTAMNVMAPDIHIILVTLVEAWGKHIIIHLKLAQKSAIIATEQAKHDAKDAEEMAITIVNIVRDMVLSDAQYVMDME